MTEEIFITDNEPKWNALEQYTWLLLRGGIKKLDKSEARAFAHLYRLAGYHLSYAKTHYPGGRSVILLNRLVGAAHNQFHLRERGGFSEVLAYFRHGFPAAMRQSSRYFCAAIALFMLGAVFAFFFISADASRIAMILPPETIGNGDVSGGGWDYPLLSAVITTNNIGVAVSAFALGILAGAGTAVVLVYNGVVLGGLTAYMLRNGTDMATYFSLILPHGVLELAAIFLSGACGLMIGKSLLMPGSYRRRDALILAAKKAAVLIPGIVLMLVLAGLIEGFFTPLAAVPAWLKLVFAWATSVWTVAYFSAGWVPKMFDVHEDETDIY